MIVFLLVCLFFKIANIFLFHFPDNAQRAQYEEWLQETQQLLQMQQKFLEEKIGAHRKSKKALSAKQRTAKKAGREFPEEDAEQLKHVTEQQGVVQKQLEQVYIPSPHHRRWFVSATNCSHLRTKNGHSIYNKKKLFFFRSASSRRSMLNL